MLRKSRIDAAGAVHHVIARVVHWDMKLCVSIFLACNTVWPVQQVAGVFFS